MSKDDRHIEDDAPLAWGASTRITVSLEPEAAAMLEAMVSRMDPSWRIGARRAEIIEQGIRTIYHRMYKNTQPEDIPQAINRLRAMHLPKSER